MAKPEPEDAADLGLYVHIPFCSSICNYCNFNRGLFDSALKDRYVGALVEEIRRSPFRGRAADTIFFGGGTPSLLDPREIARLVDALRHGFDVAPDAEITLETNPETVDQPKLEGFRAAGVNRVSFGVQSFHDDELVRLGRIHSADRARQALAAARDAGIDNVSLDLMMWLPGQSVDRWLANVEALIAAGPEHASLYLLELYPNAPLKDEMARAGWSQMPDDDAADMYVQAMERLESHGYAQYEISNVARPGRASRHNLKYWTDGEWVGFGCGAHSTVGGVRWKNVSGTGEYAARIAAGTSVVTERRVLSRDERLGDALFTGLRLSEGIDLAAVGRRYGIDVWARYGNPLRPHIDGGWLVRQGERLALTRAGMLMANEVMSVFV
ncbi:MAG TPA: radical SAM family heme chaperone HemW [Vicinamibacterales bacterium]|nr:radical SAM family heme chaperone HemW [Vicinamibacterales bacterium]